MAKGTAARLLSATAAAAALCGCMNFSALDDLGTASPAGSPFDKALFEDYAFLARSFGEMGQASYAAFDQNASYSLASADNQVAALANAFADKALAISRGEVVNPEPSRDIKTHDLRDRLVRALTTGSGVYPRDAARAQADWDCWRLNLEVPSQAAAAERCHRSFEVTLVRLESEAKAVAAAAAAEKKAAAQTPAEERPSQPVLEDSE